MPDKFFSIILDIPSPKGVGGLIAFLGTISPPFSNTP
jgi:hypothetical protein